MGSNFVEHILIRKSFFGNSMGRASETYNDFLTGVFINIFIDNCDEIFKIRGISAIKTGIEK